MPEMIKEEKMEEEKKKNTMDLIFCGAIEYLIPIEECIMCEHNPTKKVKQHVDNDGKKVDSPGYTTCVYPIRKGIVKMMKGVIK